MDNIYYILGAAGDPTPCDVKTWAMWFELADRQVARDVVRPRRVRAISLNGDNTSIDTAEIVVSTVFLGLNHQFGAGPPILYETMIFGGPHADYCDRYSTRAEALAGHALALDLARMRA